MRVFQEGWGPQEILAAAPDQKICRFSLLYADQVSGLGVSASSTDCDVDTEPKMPPCAAIIARPAAWNPGK
jgi:hypothetical protein